MTEKDAYYSKNVDNLISYKTVLF